MYVVVIYFLKLYGNQLPVGKLQLRVDNKVEMFLIPWVQLYVVTVLPDWFNFLIEFSNGN